MLGWQIWESLSDKRASTPNLLVFRHAMLSWILGLGSMWLSNQEQDGREAERERSRAQFRGTFA